MEIDQAKNILAVSGANESSKAEPVSPRSRVTN